MYFSLGMGGGMASHLLFSMTGYAFGQDSESGDIFGAVGGYRSHF
jgi:hypothetical protein